MPWARVNVESGMKVINWQQSGANITSLSDEEYRKLRQVILDELNKRRRRRRTTTTEMEATAATTTTTAATTTTTTTTTLATTTVVETPEVAVSRMP